MKKLCIVLALLFCFLPILSVSAEDDHPARLIDGAGLLTEDEQLALLASDGMLVKRPLLVADDFVLPGFKPAEWEKALL